LVEGMNPLSVQVINEIFPAAIIHGGNYTLRTDAGVYAISARTSPAVSAATTGFRCVR